jgi:hypothetical protein
MRRHLILGLLLLLAPLQLGCQDSTDRVDSGGVLLRITDFGTLPLVLSLRSIGLLQIDSVTMRSFPADPNGTTSDLMTIQLDAYEVTYTRADRGTVVPRPIVGRIFGSVPVNGTNEINNLNFLQLDQLSAQPFSGLARDGKDDETGSSAIGLNVHFRFFGKTLSGKAVASDTASFTIEVVP